MYWKKQSNSVKYGVVCDLLLSPSPCPFPSAFFVGRAHFAFCSERHRWDPEMLPESRLDYGMNHLRQPRMRSDQDSLLSIHISLAPGPIISGCPRNRHLQSLQEHIGMRQRERHGDDLFSHGGEYLNSMSASMSSASFSG